MWCYIYIYIYIYNFQFALDTVLLINKITFNNFFKKLIFFKPDDTKIILFQVKHYTIETDIIRYFNFFF